MLSALIRRFHEAKQSEAPEVVLWGTGTPRRELIHADDVADAVYFLLQRDTDHCDFPVNIGTGVDYSVAELAQLVARIVGYSGMIGWDKTRPDGAPQKLLDNSRLLKMGWRPRVALRAVSGRHMSGFCPVSRESVRSNINITAMDTRVGRIGSCRIRRNFSLAFSGRCFAFA